MHFLKNETLATPTNNWTSQEMTNLELSWIDALLSEAKVTIIVVDLGLGGLSVMADLCSKVTIHAPL